MSFKLFIIFVIYSLSFQAISQEEKLYATTFIPTKIMEEANAVIRLNQIDVNISAQDKMTITIKRIVSVFNESGNSSVNAFAGFDKNRKIKKIQAVVFDDEGKEIKKYKKSDFVDHSAVDGGTLYSDSRVLFMPYLPIKYPYTVEFTCEIESPNTAGLPSFAPIESYYLGVEKSIYTLTDNANLGLRTQENNFKEFNIEVQKTDHVVSYAASNINAIRPEELGPNFHTFTPNAKLAVNKFHFDGVDGEAANWKEFGNWMQNSLLSGRDVLPQQTKVNILALTSNIPNALDRAKLVYEFVQNNTRYISVQVGIGGIQPILASEVDQLKYGDCKGLTNYTQALLKVANVESYYTVVEAGEDIEDFDPEFASLEQGNHIILGIPNNEEMVWLDCTSQYHPFGFIGNFTDNRNVLQVRSNESAILKTAKYVDGDNYQHTKVNASIGSDASLIADVSIKTTGIQYDSRFLLAKESEDEIQKYYKNQWSYINNLSLINHKFDDDKNKVQFSEELKISARSYATVNKDQIIFCPNAFNRNTYVPDRYRNRQLPLVIQRGFMDEDEFIFKIPEGYSVEALPESVSIVNIFGEYQANFKEENNQIIFTKKLLIKNGSYPKSEYENYRTFRKDVAKHEASLVLLKLKT